MRGETFSRNKRRVVHFYIALLINAAFKKKNIILTVKNGGVIVDSET